MRGKLSYYEYSRILEISHRQQSESRRDAMQAATSKAILEGLPDTSGSTSHYHMPQVPDMELQDLMFVLLWFGLASVSPFPWYYSLMPPFWNRNFYPMPFYTRSILDVFCYYYFWKGSQLCVYLEFQKRLWTLDF